MKQLNNKENGHFIRLDKIDILQNRICYTEYQNIVYRKVIPEPIIDILGGSSIQPDSYIEIVKEFKNESKSYTFTLINLNNYLNTSTNFTELCFNQLIIELFPDWIIEDGLQNWLFNRPIRTIILNSLILEHLKPINTNGDLSALGQLIQRVRVQHYDYYEDNHSDDITVIYFNTIVMSDYLVIKDYLNSSIWSELKIIE